MSTDLTLPPCKVCHGKSTGIHYGVVSCFACKAFFGRFIKGKNRQVCQKQNRCKFKSDDKHYCAPCRFQKCLQVGMSKKASKTGRYSLQRRHDMKIERQKLDLIQQENAVDKGPNGESLDDIISSILQAYDGLPSHVYASQEVLDNTSEKYKEEIILKRRLFGQMPTVACEEFEEIFRSTGLDIDNRLQAGDLYIKAVLAWFAKLIVFVKAIPGFRDLSHADQFNLIKYNRFEFWFIGAYKGYNSKLETVVYPNGHKDQKEDMKKTLPGDISEVLFDVASNLKRRDLTPTELVFVQTMTLFFADRAPLEDRPAVERIQRVLMSCLEKVVKKRPDHKSQVRALGHAADMMTIVRSVCHVDEVGVARESFAGKTQLLKMDLMKGIMAWDMAPL